MKRRMNFILVMVLALTIFIPISSNAKVVEKTTAKISHDIIITVNGEVVPFKVAIIKGRSYLPVRVIGHALNSEVNWIDSKRNITLDTKKERLVFQEFHDLVSISSGEIKANRVDDISLFMNDKYYKDISEEIVLIESRSYLPIRSISEQLGIRSTWNPKTNTIEIINPRTVEIDESIKEDYITDLPVIESQEDYLVGNWKGTTHVPGNPLGMNHLEDTVFISRNNDGSYKVIRTMVTENGSNAKNEYKGIYNEEDNTLLCKFKKEISSNANWFERDITYGLDGEILFRKYDSDGSTSKSTWKRF